MTPPKRPFTTSSLTSTLKSTIASQPLLSNISSQATSFAQKTPFFSGSIGGQQQQQQHQQHYQDAQPATSASQQHQQANNQAGGTNMMMRGQPTAAANAAQQQRPPMASTPTVDMSHLTKEEREMIESVMAKAEMADMGMPVDTSAPGSTNLPSSTSLALTQSRTNQQQQQQQHQQQQHQQQQHQQNHQHQVANQSMIGSNSGTNAMNQQRPQQHQQPNNNLPAINQAQRDFMQMHQNQPTTSTAPNNNNNIGCNPMDASYQNNQQNMNLMGGIQSFNQVQQQQFQPHQAQQPQPQQQVYQNMQAQPTTQVAQANNVQDLQANQSNLSAQSLLDARNNLPLLEQNSQQLVNHINSQFNLGQNNQQQQLSSQRNIGGMQNPSQQFPNQQHPMTSDHQAHQVDTQAAQQMHFQQGASNVGSFDRSMLIQSQSGVNPQQMHNSIINQQAVDAQFQQQQAQQQLQQQQQQSQLNTNLDAQTRLMQSNQGLPMSLGLAQDPIISGQLRDTSLNSQQQQQLQQQSQFVPNIQQTSLSNYPTSRSQQIDMMNPQLNLNNFPQLKLNEPTMRTNLSGQQQATELQSADVGLQRGDVHFTSAVNSGSARGMINQQVPLSPNFNNEMPHHQGQRNYSREQYNDSRGEIKFGPQQHAFDSDYNDHALSDQEYHSTPPRRHIPGMRRHDSATTRYVKPADQTAKEMVDACDRNLQAYDLAHRNPQGSNRHAKSRQLPQPTNRPDCAHQSPIEQLQGESGPRSRSRESSRPVANRRANNRDSRQDSPKYLSGSDEEVAVEDKKEGNGGAANRKSPGASGISKDVVDKSDEALKLLSELKLSEQANQVMEQQQLLIKQSQELIKLQLEQQALSQELKKSIKQQSITPSNNDQEQSSKTNKEPAKESTADQDVQKVEKGNQEEDQMSRRKESSELKKIEDDQRSSMRMTKLESTRNKSTSFCNDHDSDLEDSPRANSKFSLTRPADFDDDSATGLEQERKSRLNEQRERIGRVTNVANAAAQTCPSPRYNRDLLQSPTDTTDSDVEPLTQSNLRRNQRLNQTKPKSVMRRREPTGLPPSPLPVAAAIQLHQMQQQHYKQAGTNSRNASNRTNFLRSRSVTSSPNHLFDQTNSGYLTDSQRIRSTSPDTLSEFGGQRRRKRLPEPPTNTVPITPSMVRKMIQAQRAGSTPGKLLNSVNAQSTLLTNTHSNRSLAFERHDPANQNTLTGRAPAINDPHSRSFSHTVNPAAHQTSAADSSAANQSSSLPLASTSRASSDLNKFLSSTYGNSILRNNISDVKETPELDKLISNLDEYYGLDSKRHVRLAQSSAVPEAYTSAPATSASSSILPSPTRAAGLNYSPLAYSSKPTHSSNAPLMRCNSEGESSLTSRIQSTRPSSYRQQNLDDYRSSYSRHLAPNSYLNGRSSSYLNSSLVSRQATRYAGPQYSTTPEKYRDYTTTKPTSDYWMSSATIDPKLDRSSQPYRPMQSSQYSAYSRLHNPTTGSFDGESLDYLPTSAPIEQRPHSSSFTDTYGSSGRYQQRYTNAGPSIDSIRDKYRYPGVQDTSKNDRSDFNASTSRYLGSEFTEPKRSNPTSQFNLRQFQHRSLDIDPSKSAYPSWRSNPSAFDSRSKDLVTTNQIHDQLIEPASYHNDSMRVNSSPLGYLGHYDHSRLSSYAPDTVASRSNVTSSGFVPLTKDDIINNGPRFDSIGYRFRTENQNKYVAQARTPTQCLQSRYPNPYKRILLSKNPKDRIGNGIGVRITGGLPIPSLYDKVNRCIVTSGAFVTEVFQNSNVYFMDEMHEGDQIIEWNGVNLCNRSNEEVQQILLSQFSDDEVEIVYLHQDSFNEAYGESNLDTFNERNFHDAKEQEIDPFDALANLNKADHISSRLPVTTRSRYANETTHKGSIRRKISLSSIAHMWSR